MKKALLVLCLTVSALYSIAQSNETSKTKYTFSQIGWTFSAPDNFKLIDSSSNTLNPTPEVEIWRKQLMFTNSRNTLILSISKSSQKGIDWENIHKKEEKHFFDQSRIRQPTIQFDSLSTILAIDSITFSKFAVIGKENGKIVRNHVQLSSYIKGYRFNIVYEFTDIESQEQIEKAIANSKFIR